MKSHPRHCRRPSCLPKVDGLRCLPLVRPNLQDRINKQVFLNKAHHVSPPCLTLTFGWKFLKFVVFFEQVLFRLCWFGIRRTTGCLLPRHVDNTTARVYIGQSIARALCRGN